MDGLRTLELGTPGELRQELVGLVLSGFKRATAGLLSDYEIEGEALESVGERLVLVGDDGKRVGVVEITGMDVVPFAEVTDDFARAEGEGFAGHLDWATAHRAYWERIGRRIDENTPVVCLRFTFL
jgi:uncharacterized protein YhfF